MGDKNKIKSKDLVTIDMVPEKLRELAAMIEQREIELHGKKVDIKRLESFKVSVKYKVSKPAVEVKVTAEPVGSLNNLVIASKRSAS